MANFETAYPIVLVHEGTYANNPNDAGKETYRGISRVNNPNWPGWVIIDSYKPQPNFPASLDADTQLQLMVHDFYYQRWNAGHYGDIADDRVAGKIFDACVLSGKAPKLFQRVINYLAKSHGRQQITVDGVFGQNTVLALNSLIGLGIVDDILDCLRMVLAGYYEGLYQEVPSYKVFINGWEDRADD